MIKTWKAGGTIADRVASQFVGGSPEIGDVSYAGVPADAKDKPVHSRLGFVADSSGEIKVRVNIVTQTKADASAAAKKGLGLLKGLLGKDPAIRAETKKDLRAGTVREEGGCRGRRVARAGSTRGGEGAEPAEPGRGAEGHAAVQEGGGGEAGAGAAGALRYAGTAAPAAAASVAAGSSAAGVADAVARARARVSGGSAPGPGRRPAVPVPVPRPRDAGSQHGVAAGRARGGEHRRRRNRVVARRPSRRGSDARVRHGG